MNTANTYRAGPDPEGHFGIFGGRYVAETLMPLILDLEAAWGVARKDTAFTEEMSHWLKHYVGRPSPLYHARRLSEYWNGAKIYFKRDELNHTGAHKINNCIGQILLAKRMGKTRIIAETGAGQHGVATATVCALFNLPCTVYMGEVDIARQKPNVFRMKLLGAEVVSVTSGSRTLKDAMNEALRDWVTNVEDTYYLIGTVAGPHPYPEMVREFQSVIGEEVREQIMQAEGRLPDTLVACVGGGSNAAGMFYPFINDAAVRLTGVEAGGLGADCGKHASPLTYGDPGVLHGSYSYVMQDDDGQTSDVHSISAGLDYPGVGPEHSYWKTAGRVEYTTCEDRDALTAFDAVAACEGILPALESSHAVSQAMKIATAGSHDEIVVVCLSGRGDKDASEIARLRDVQLDLDATSHET